MDEIARLTARDRADLFNEASRRRGNMGPILIEKDFWVCWTLKRIFTMPVSPVGLVFKGGTSLSKVYGIIDRFSEDVDLSFDRAALGFSGENDPAKAASKKQADRRLDELSAACRRMIRESFLGELSSTMESALGRSSSGDDWMLGLDPEDPEEQTLLFRYSPGLEVGEGPTSRYLRPTVRLELGARGEQWPMELAKIRSYAAEEISAPFKEPGCEVKVLSARHSAIPLGPASCVAGAEEPRNSGAFRD